MSATGWGVAAGGLAFGVLLAAGIAPGAPETPDERDPQAVKLAESVLAEMGGREAWDATRYLRWRFFGRRLHHWDRWTGDIRIEVDDVLILMNVHTREGRVWEGGSEITDPEELASTLEQGYALWVNDSYWLIMPYKLLDPGVRLRFDGDAELADGRAADRMTVTFDSGTGLTSRNKYEVWVARGSGLVEQWAYYEDAENAEPGFTLPWAGWEYFGDILLATDHGRGKEWEIAVPDSLPRALFERP